MREIEARVERLAQQGGTVRAVAQLGRALRSGRRGRGFKSHQPDVLHRGGECLLNPLMETDTAMGYCHEGEATLRFSRRIGRPDVIYLPESVLVPGPN